VNVPGSSDIREAFNAAAAGKATATQAFHRYDHAHDAETEIIRFVGTLENGELFDIESGKLRGGSDLATASREVAAALLAKQKVPSP
jgi:hypothetical protein